MRLVSESHISQFHLDSPFVLLLRDPLCPSSAFSLCLGFFFFGPSPKAIATREGRSYSPDSKWLLLEHIRSHFLSLPPPHSPFLIPTESCIVRSSPAEIIIARAMFFSFLLLLLFSLFLLSFPFFAFSCSFTRWERHLLSLMMFFAPFPFSLFRFPWIVKTCPA